MKTIVVVVMGLAAISARVSIAQTAAPVDSSADSTGISAPVSAVAGAAAGAAAGAVPAPNLDMKITGYPYAYYTPETELAVGVGGIVTFYTGHDKVLRPSKATVSAYYTTKQQYKITLAPELYFSANKFFGSLNFDYGRYVDKFWGVGNTTPDIDNTDYVAEGWGAKAEFQLPPVLNLFSVTRVGIIYRFSYRDITDDLGNPFLVDQSVQGAEAGSISGVGFSWTWDNRDQIFYPQKGGYNRLSGVYYTSDLGSDYDFNRYELDIRHYIGLKKERVVALQTIAQATFGETPFYELPALGGQRMMRGYYEGRYRDRLYLAGQAEYRTHLFWKVGAVGFIGAGNVAHEIGAFNVRDFKISSGAGLRLLFNEAEHVNLRVDLGFGPNTNGLYFGLEEAF
jgi:outer membrane protein assembly factor BamA